MEKVEKLVCLLFAAVRTTSKPIAFGIRKGADMHPRFKQFIAEMAQSNQINEKELIDSVAQRCVVYTAMAGSAIVYDRRRQNKEVKKYTEEIRQSVTWTEEKQKHWEEVVRELQELREQLKIVENENECD